MPRNSESPARLPLKRAWPFLGANGLGDEAVQIRTEIAGLHNETSRVRRGRVIRLLRQRGLLDKFIDEEWPTGTTEQSKRLMDQHEQVYQRYLDGDLGSGDDDAEDEEDPTDTGFAQEEDLRDYLVTNLHLIEPGLQPWPADKGGALEHPVDGRRIDILARDQSGVPVVIELKVSRGHERTIGQALYYRAKVRDKFGEERVRIILVAREIGQELKMACRELLDVSLFEYQLSMTVSPAQ
jgi:hypothetical protein